jgi:hypothetical protein
MNQMSVTCAAAAAAAQVLEYLWLLNSHHEWVYKHMHGDKDTFLLAFAMAGRLADFKQVRATLQTLLCAWAR